MAGIVIKFALVLLSVHFQHLIACWKMLVCKQCDKFSFLTLEIVLVAVSNPN